MDGFTGLLVHYAIDAGNAAPDLMHFQTGFGLLNFQLGDLHRFDFALCFGQVAARKSIRSPHIF